MTTNAAPAENFEKELKSTELGEFLLKNKSIAIGILALIVVAILGAGIYKYLGEQKDKKAADAFFTIESTSLVEFNEGKLDAKELVASFNDVKTKFDSKNAVVTSGLIFFDALIAKGNVEEAQSIITALDAQNNFQKFLINSRAALALEKSGDVNGAIKKLEAITALGLKIQEGKLFTDLGRLYLKIDNKEMAKKSFEYVKSINTENVFKSLATYYLQSLN